MNKKIFGSGFGIVLAILFVWNGCSVKYSMSGADIPIEAKTVSVNYFQNYAANIHPTLSQDLTEALREKFQSQTSLRLVNGVGDLHFEGEIKGYDIKAQDIQGDETASKQRLTIVVHVRFTNAYKSTSDFESDFSRYEDYDANLTFESVSDDLNKKIIDFLVEDIFNKSVVNW